MDLGLQNEKSQATNTGTKEQKLEHKNYCLQDGMVQQWVALSPHLKRFLVHIPTGAFLF